MRIPSVVMSVMACSSSSRTSKGAFWGAGIFVNLLKNAREAVGTRRDACIEVSSRIDPQENVVIEISNNGGAIPAEVTENIFTPFFTTKPDGSGIGLSVSRRIMQLHNGSLRLTANTDNRVTFTLLFG